MSSVSRRVLISTFLLVAAINGACTSSSIVPPSGAESVVADRLMFGRAIPSGGVVSDEEWQAFVAEVVTPRFREGLTVWQGNGQWLDAQGRVVREPMFAIEIFHRGTTAEDAAMREIALEYKKRFRQEAVLRVSAPTSLRFY